MKTFRGFLLHICVICSFIILIADILDWHNPYMNFAGHLPWVQIVLCVTTILLSVTKPQRPPHLEKDCR